MQVTERASGTLPGYLTIAEAAQLLHISKGALYSRLYRSGHQATKVGRTLLLPVDVVMCLYEDVREYKRSGQ